MTMVVKVSLDLNLTFKCEWCFFSGDGSAPCATYRHFTGQAPLGRPIWFIVDDNPDIIGSSAQLRDYGNSHGEVQMRYPSRYSVFRFPPRGTKFVTEPVKMKVTEWPSVHWPRISLRAKSADMVVSARWCPSMKQRYRRSVFVCH